MAIPDFTIDPNQFEAGDLPANTTITGTEIFERPDYTGRELFTQSGDDAPIGDWIGDAVQIEGIIGDGFEGSGTGFLSKDSDMPDYKSTNFIGFSAFIDVYDLAGNNCIMSIKEDLDTTNRPIEIVINSTFNFYVWSTSSSGNGKVVSTGFLPNINQLYHVFAYVDFTSGTNIRFFLDGVEYTNVPFNGGVSSFASDDADKFRIGARTNNGALSSAFKGSICNAYWSTNPDFANHLDKYANLAIVEVN